ncbi:MAG: metalloprotease PmbA [Methylophilaceae bacterium]|nr:metalloprotease PmbA [Methylophilaceae bacterium]
MSVDTRFSLSLDQLKELSQQALRFARACGASAAEAEISLGFGQTVTVRMGEVETIEHNRERSLYVTVYFGHRCGHASTSDLSLEAMRDTVQAACSIARHTAEDPYCGLAEVDFLARQVPALDLYHPWEMTVDDAIALALACEQAALDFDKRITNSEGATVATQEGLFAYANSHGFCEGYPSSRHALSCSVIAEQDQMMQRDHWYTTARSAADLEPAQHVGRTAALRAVRRLGARRLRTRQVPVLFEPSLASGLLSHFISAISGGNLYRRSSFLLDALGQPVFSPVVHISERPHLPKGLASRPFDQEGVATRDRELVIEGVLQGYVLSSYSARKLGMSTTGNAGGPHNLIVQPGANDFAKMLRLMDTGLVVTELLGQGVNLVTGDYSRGAAGFWVEHGEILFPVEEITIAGNLKEMFRQIVAVGNDVFLQSARQCGSLLIEQMTVAGE